MTRPIDTHIGPWTLADVLELPDDDNRYEVIEGVLHVSPAAARRHIVVQARLERSLLPLLPEGYDAFDGGMGLTVGSSFVIPDLVVVRDDGASAYAEPSEILLAVEVESTGSVRRDRVLKPRLFARHGIPASWRVEMGDELTIVAYTLGEGAYIETARATGDQILTVDRPFSVQLRPADLDPLCEPRLPPLGGAPTERRRG